MTASEMSEAPTMNKRPETGSYALDVTRSVRMQHLDAQQVKLGASVHLLLQVLQPVDLADS